MDFNTQRKMCFEKTQYPSKKDAQTALNSAMKRRGRHGRAERLRIYPCPVCKSWHMSKSGFKDDE